MVDANLQEINDGAAVRLGAVLKRSFSPEARILAVSVSPHLVLMVSWRLETDTSRPANRSKTIRLIIEEEAIEEYLNASEPGRQMADARLEYHIQELLGHLDWDRPKLFDEETPTVRLIIGAVTLLG